MNDEEYMKIALQLAVNGCGWTSPNPMVGAVIVKNGEVIGKGWHEKYGDLHAECNALLSCTKSPKGSTMYVTLEPCSHYGKQPPCVDAILNAGITRVVIGSGDPNPLVSGKGIRILRKNGIEVTENVLKNECDRLNEAFFHYIRTRHPFVVMKYAMTMDGKIAAYTGDSKWITGEIARDYAHRQRRRYRAIMVGVGTVLSDDPLLTCRIGNSREPIRVICDTNLRTPLTAQIVCTAAKIPTIIATCCSDKQKMYAFQEMGCHILQIKRKDGQGDLRQLMEILGQNEIDSVLLEGGGTLNWSALQSGIVQKVQAYIAPKLFGGRYAITPVEGIGVSSPNEGLVLKNSVITRLGEDILIESEVSYDVYRDH